LGWYLIIKSPTQCDIRYKPLIFKIQIMKKLLKIQYGILAFMLLSMIACKKDVKIPKDVNTDIRVLKVQYIGHDYSSDFVFNPPFPMYTKECTYYYDSEGRLSHIKNDDILRAKVEYDKEQITVTNEVEQDSQKAFYWENSIISYRNNKIENILIATPYWEFPSFPSGPSIDNVSISRASDGRLNSVMLERSPNAPVPSTILFFELATDILSYNDNGLPNKLETPLFYWSDPDYYTADFTFQYNEAEDVPMKLKRLVNEELLFSNRYGITNFDLLYIDSTRNFSQLGEGNWLISFGLPQYYILEEKSTYLVSKRTTTFYKGGVNEGLDPDGSKEFFKTKVEDFPYIHDAKAKTLEIAGLKIWYEFVE
jgi:hypothetical protein